MRSKMSPFSLSNKKGFTLIELLLVIAIIGVLATIAIKTVQEETKKANDTQAVSMMRNLLTALETQTPTDPGYNGVVVNGGTLQWDSEPSIQLGKHLYVTIEMDSDGDTGEGKWQVFGAHIGGKLGYYFWVPDPDCTVEQDDKITDTGGSATPADRIVPSAGEIAQYTYTDFRSEAIP